jgi:transposase-like protein
MCDKNKVYSEYFYNGKKITEIAKEEGVSKQAISKILKQFPEYAKEKQKRKAQNHKKHNQQIGKIANQKRKSETEEDKIIMACLKQQQEKHAMLMSRTRKLSTDTLVELNINHYRYDKEHERIVFSESPNEKPFDLPRTVKVHKNIINIFDNFSQNLEKEKFNSTVEQKALT